MSLLSELEAWTMAGAGQVVDRPDIPLHKSAPLFDLEKRCVGGLPKSSAW